MIVCGEKGKRMSLKASSCLCIKVRRRTCLPWQPLIWMTSLIRYWKSPGFEYITKLNDRKKMKSNTEIGLYRSHLHFKICVRECDEHLIDEHSKT